MVLLQEVVLVEEIMVLEVREEMDIILPLVDHLPIMQEVVLVIPVELLVYDEEVHILIMVV